jgi:hypothetical protein
VADAWRAATPGATSGVVLRAVPLATHVAGELRPITRLLVAAVAFVLLVACANVACLQLVRATGRARELAVRAAVGAGRASLVRPLAAESLVIAGAGGAAGVALAVGTLAVLRRVDLSRYPQLADVRLGVPVLAGALATTALAALAFGLAPALRAMRSDPQAALRASSRGSSAGVDRHRFLRAAVVTQVALAMSLAMGAGLLVKSLARLAATDPGFRADAVLTAYFGLPRAAYPDAAARVAAHDRVAERLRATPGVAAVGLSMALPFGEGLDSSPFAVVGRPPAGGGATPHAEYNIVSEDWFRTMGIALRRGRAFTGADALGAPPVVVIDEQLAREHFPGEDPIGRRLTQNGEAEIVGVVASVPNAGLAERRKAKIYYPLRQSPAGAVAVAVRGALPPAAAERAVRAAVADVDRQVPVFDVRAMRARVDDSVGARRLATTTFGAFAAVALCLAALGVYGVLSYVTAQRARELGVRAAFGARAEDLRRMVLGGGARLAAAGVAAGTVLFLGLRRVLAALLYGVGPADPAALGAGAAVLAAAVLLASWLPARRAGRATPRTRCAPSDRAARSGGRLPPARLRRAEERVEHRHVADRVLERHRHRAGAAHRLGEPVGLQRVLVDAGEVEHLGRAARRAARPAVVHDDPRRALARGAERQLDLDAPGGAEDVHALVVRELAAARERGLAVGEAEQPRREAVDAERRVALHEPDDGQRLGAEQPAGDGDRVAADVQERAAAPLGAAADVGRVVAEVAEVPGDEAERAHAPGAHEVAHGEPLRVRAHHERLGDLHAGAVAGGEQGARVGGRQRQRLLAEHVLARLRRAHRTRGRAGGWAAGCRPRPPRGRRAAPRTTRRRAGRRARRPRRAPSPRRARRWRRRGPSGRPAPPG